METQGRTFILNAYGDHANERISDQKNFGESRSQSLVSAEVANLRSIVRSYLVFD